MEAFRVPEGHHVEVHVVSREPGIVTSGGGIWFAHFGSSSDDALAEVDALIERVEQLVGGPRPKVLLCAEGIPLHRLCEPTIPVALQQEAGLLVWVGDAEALASAEHAERVIQKWLGTLHRCSKAIAQLVFLHHLASPRARAIAELLAGMGIPARTPHHDGTTIVEVHRPDAVIAGIAGSIHPVERPDPFAHETNLAKDHSKDVKSLEREERSVLAQRLAPPPNQPRVAAVERSPRLSRTLLAVANQSSDAFPALCKELLERTVPLLVIVDPKTMSSSLRQFPGGRIGLAVYCDLPTLHASALAIGMQPGTFGASAMPPDKLFPWAASQDWMIALCVFRAPDQPLYIPMDPETVHALARTLAAKT